MARSILVLLWAACAAFSQSPAEPVAFEVASVKPNLSGSGSSSYHTTHGEVRMQNLSLKRLIELAYGMHECCVSGPGWLETVKFDIDAKPSAPVPDDRIAPMLQALLIERFKLAVHRESKVLPAYALVVAKSGSKLHPSEPGNGSSLNSHNNQMTAQRVTMAGLAEFLSRRLERPVIDQTGIVGGFDFNLDWTPDEATPPAPGDTAERRRPDYISAILAALQPQLGLRIEAEKLPMDVLVVDHAERTPTEN